MDKEKQGKKEKKNVNISLHKVKKIIKITKA